MTVIVNCSALNDNEFTGTPEEYMEQFAGFVSESEIKDFTAVQNQEYTEKFTYPAYELELPPEQTKIPANGKCCISRQIPIPLLMLTEFQRILLRRWRRNTGLPFLLWN